MLPRVVRGQIPRRKIVLETTLRKGDNLLDKNPESGRDIFTIPPTQRKSTKNLFKNAAKVLNVNGKLISEGNG